MVYFYHTIRDYVIKSLHLKLVISILLDDEVFEHTLMGFAVPSHDIGCRGAHDCLSHSNQSAYLRGAQFRAPLKQGQDT